MTDQPEPEARGGLPADRLAALAALTGGFAHDFNNLLTVIRGSAELARARGGDHRAELDAIQAAADEAARLTGQLLAFARRQPLRPRATALGPLLAGLRDELVRHSGDAVRVRLLAPPGLPPAMVDPAGLADALGAVADNALAALPDGGVLTLAAGVQGGLLRIVVSDSGAGMPPTVLARACEPFFTTKPVGAGSGLGLAQVHGFAAQSGGRAEIDSAPGRGTSVTLFLPLATGDALAHPDRAAPPPAHGTRVLLVEDSNTVAAFAETLLADMGCTVTRAACAAEALDRLGEGRFDILFSDIVMPGMSGIDLARRVRTERPELPILLATGHSEQAATTTSPFPIVTKPYRRDTLSQMMGQALAA